MPPPGVVATPPGVPVNTVPQNLLGNAAGFAAMGVANGGTAAINTATGLGTAEASVVAIVQNFVAQLVKHHPHFDEKHWLEPFMVIVGLPVAFLGFWAHLDPLQAGFKTIVTAIQGSQIAKVQFHAAQATVMAGALPPVAPENQYDANPHLWPAPNSPGWGMTFSPPPSSTSGAPEPIAPAGPPTAGAPTAATFPNPMSFTPGGKA